MALSRKTNEEVLESDGEAVINERHASDWTNCVKGDGVKFTVMSQRNPKKGNFNYAAGETAPKSVRYRQLLDSGNLITPVGESTYVRGDYMFMDASVGKVIVPFKLFQLLFT